MCATSLISYDDTAGMARYVQIARCNPVLTLDEELHLVWLWTEKKDKTAAQKLVMSHVRLVIKIAIRYRNYGLVMADMVSEGVVGLVRAVQKFDPKRGVRFATYATWWVKAQIQSFIINSWSLVKIGTTSAQRKLFFGLRSMRNKIMQCHGVETLSATGVKEIADNFSVSQKDVLEMEARMLNSDVSLNRTMRDEDDVRELVDVLPSIEMSSEENMIARESNEKKIIALHRALSQLSPREREVIILRKYSERPATLETLATKYSISAERVRQIQEAAMKKMKLWVADTYLSLTDGRA